MLTLRAGRLSLVLAPEAGGAILGWSFGGIPLLRRADGRAVVQNDVRGMGCFPLVPYANRIAEGRFSWGGRAWQLDRNFGDHPHSIHGIGWQRPWTVGAVSDTEACLTLVHDGEGADWPFAFVAEQRLVLRPDALRVEMRVTSRHHAAAPAGLGLHPYFPRAPGAALRFRAGSVWLNDANALPDRLVPMPEAWDHASGVAVGAVTLDNCFNGWDGAAHLDLGAVAVTIKASAAFGHLQIYTPPGEPFFCVEPVTHRPDALNDPEGQGVPPLAPGETLAGVVTFRITEPSSAAA
jgi:aldose 1-epimerase